MQTTALFVSPATQSPVTAFVRPDGRVGDSPAGVAGKVREAGVADDGNKKSGDAVVAPGPGSDKKK